MLVINGMKIKNPTNYLQIFCYFLLVMILGIKGTRTVTQTFEM